ncbi:MAG: hypothetical protein QW332_06115 [Thermoproteota archaeon]
MSSNKKLIELALISKLKLYVDERRLEIIFYDRNEYYLGSMVLNTSLPLPTISGFMRNELKDFIFKILEDDSIVKND